MKRFTNVSFIILVVSISACSSGKLFGPTLTAIPTNTMTPTLTPTITPTPTPVICSDPNCLQPQFLACTSSVMTMPFVEGSSMIITVFGKESGLCHYGVKVVDANGNTLAGGPPSSDCRVPIEKITRDTFGHFFGMDATESIKAEQNKIENDYCIIK